MSVCHEVMSEIEEIMYWVKLDALDEDDQGVADRLKRLLIALPGMIQDLEGDKE